MRNNVNAKKDTAGKKKKKEELLNLDSVDGDNELREEDKHVETHLEEFLRLKRLLSTCPVHNGPNQFCKINAHGAHVLLTNTQLNGWAHALVRDVMGYIHCFDLL